MGADLIRSDDFISFDGTRIRFHVIGDGPNPIVLANGHGGTVDVWAPVFQCLPTHCRVITWDYRCQHGSETTKNTPTIADHYGDLGALVQHLSLQRFGLAGWSLGVQVALQGYRQHREQVGAIGLIHGAHDRLLSRVFDGRLNGFGKHAARWASAVEPAFKHIYKAPLRGLLKRDFSQHLLHRLGFVYDNHDHLQKMVQAFIELDWSTYIAVASNADEHVTEHWLHEIDIPVFLTVGERDWMTPPSQILPAFSQLKTAHLQQFEGSHFPILEEPGRVAEILGRCAELSAAERS